MKLYIANSFSLSMLNRNAQEWTLFGYAPAARDKLMESARIPSPVSDPVNVIESCEMAGAEIVSIVGHPDTAALFSKLLERRIDHNRATIQLGADDSLLVGQPVGERLPPGTTELPAEAIIEWWII